MPMVMPMVKARARAGGTDRVYRVDAMMNNPTTETPLQAHLGHSRFVGLREDKEVVR